MRNKAKNALSLAVPISPGMARQKYIKFGLCKEKNIKNQIISLFASFAPLKIGEYTMNVGYKVENWSDFTAIVKNG